MNFIDSVVNSGASRKSAKKFDGAIKGRLSRLAKDKSYSTIGLDSVLDIFAYEKIKMQILADSDFVELNKTGHNMYSSALNRYTDFLQEEEKMNEENQIVEIEKSEILDITEKSSLIQSRRGQGQFRKLACDYWKCCAATNYIQIDLLVASHIKPWSKSNNCERLDVFNSILLTPNYDRVFDRGYISFDPKGNIIISEHLQDYSDLGINHEVQIEVEYHHLKYLEFHRDEVFLN